MSPEGVNSRPPTEGGSAPPVTDGGALTFTNSAGATLSAADLVRDLRALQSDIDRVLPSLTAFNQQHGAAASQGLTGILSRILGGRTNANSGSTSPGATNIVGGIDQLLNTNAAASAQALLNPETLRRLQELEMQLRPVPELLQTLNGTSLPPEGTIGRVPNATNQYGRPGLANGVLAPTGR